MKNYKIIYTRLVKILKEELKMVSKYNKKLVDNYDLVEKIEGEGQISLLEWLLKELLPELEGKKCTMVMMDKNQFKEWKNFKGILLY